jgi:hypothetical protein
MRLAADAHAAEGNQSRISMARPVRNDGPVSWLAVLGMVLLSVSQRHFCVL